MRLLSGATDVDVDARRKFSEWVLSIGNGCIGDDNEVDKTIIVPSDLLIKSACDTLASIVQSTYPDLLESMNDITYFQNRAILTTKNSIVEKINEYMLDKVPGEDKEYLSYDSPIQCNVNGDAVDDIHTPEFLNTIVASGLPNHKLRLKVGVPVMLLRNLDIKYGLCNGTKLIITRLGRYILEGKITSESNVGDSFYTQAISIAL